MSEVTLIKFVSGEEIIATKVVDTGTNLVVENPVTLVYHRNEEGSGVSVGFAPYMPYSEGNIVVNYAAIASSSDVKTDLLAEYNRIFSNIEIFTQGSI